MNKYTLPLVATLCISLLFSCTNNDNEISPTSSSSLSDISSSSVVLSSSSSSKPSSSSATVVVSSSSIQSGVSSSSLKPSSSSATVVVSSSSSVDDPCDINSYKTVKIDSQTWMAKNLNCDVAGSICNEYDPDNCAKYGRLYNRATATSVCHSGWHLPSKDEWDVLVNFAGGASTAGTKLKATKGWNDYKGKSGNGTDEYGFSALPGGFSGGSFSQVGTQGHWWSSSEVSGSLSMGGGNYALHIGNNSDGVNFDIEGIPLYSVRCVKD